MCILFRCHTISTYPLPFAASCVSQDMIPLPDAAAQSGLELLLTNLWIGKGEDPAASRSASRLFIMLAMEPSEARRNVFYIRSLENTKGVYCAASHTRPVQGYTYLCTIGARRLTSLPRFFKPRHESWRDCAWL